MAKVFIDLKDQTYGGFSGFLLVLLEENSKFIYFVFKLYFLQFNISVPSFFTVQITVVSSGFVRVVSTCSASVT